jgi:uncharacterized protein YjbI with pentapeptide repeats
MLADASLHGASIVGALGLADASLRSSSLSDTLLAGALLRGVSLSGTLLLAVAYFFGHKNCQYYDGCDLPRAKLTTCGLLIVSLKKLADPVNSLDEILAEYGIQ